jgi:uncharacterized repeat protein (TIGR01451 family)
MHRRIPGYLAVVVCLALSAHADTFTLFSSGGNWSNIGIWYQNGSPATRTPGSQNGTVDTVDLTTPSFFTVNVDLDVIETVTLLSDCPSNTSTCVVDVLSGGTLYLTGASVIGTDARLKLTGGTIDNIGTLQFSSTADFDWTSGTLSGTGTTSINSGANLNATGPGSMILAGGQQLAVAGTMTYSGGSFAQNGGADLAIANGGTFDLQTINGIATDNSSTATITVLSGGLFKKSAGAFGTNIDPTFFNQGTVQVDVSSLVLGRGTHTGSFVLNGATTAISFAFPGTHTFSGTTGSISGAGEAFFGGTVQMLAGADLDISNLENDGFASVSGTGTINLSGTWTWNSGTFSGVTVNALPGSIVNTSGGTLVTSAHLNSQGTVTVSGNISVNSGAHITNDGSIVLSGDVSINSNGVANARIDNLATRSILKSSGAATATIQAAVNNDGSINVTSGSLKLTGGGTHTGTFFTAAANNGIAFDGGTHQVTAGTFSGLGQVAVGAGVLDLDTNLTFATLSFQLKGGTLSGSGTLTFNGPFTWSAGTILGPGGVVTVATATLNHSSPTGATALDQRTLNLNNCNFAYSAGAFGLTLRNIATINVNSGSSFTSQDAGNVLNDGWPNTIAVAAGGTLIKSGGAGASRFDVRILNNGGTVTSAVNGESLILNAGGIQTSGNLTVTGTALLDINWPLFEIQGGGISGTGKLRVQNGGALKITTPLATSTPLEINSGGTLDSTVVTAFDSLTWNGGVMMGTGGQTRALNAAITNAAPTSLLGTHTFDIMTTGSYSGDNTNYLTVEGTLRIGNGATLQLTTDGRIASHGTGVGTLQNLGTLTKSGGTGVSLIELALDSNTDQISVGTSGTLKFSGLGTVQNTVLNTGTGKLEFSGGGMFLNTGTTLTGSGWLVVSGGVLVIQVPVTIPNLELKGGAIGGSGALLVNGGKWSAGDMDSGATTTINSGSTFEISSASAKTLSRPLVNNGTLFTISAPASLGFSNGITLTNNNLLELQSNTTFTCNCTPASTIVNSSGATLRQYNAAGLSTIFPNLNNAGTIDVDTGTLHLRGDGTHSGSFTPDSGALLTFGGASQNFSAATSVTGAGSVTFTASSALFDGTFSIGGPSSKLTIDGGATFNSASSISATALDLRSGTLGGTAAIQIAGGPLPSNWVAGTITGTGAFTLGAGTPWTLSASNGALTLDARTITNNGSMLYTASVNALTLTNGATITNNGLFELKSDAPINAGASTNSILHAGTFEKVLTAGTSAIAPVFSTSGIVNVVNGTVAFNGGFSQSAGTSTVGAGATLSSPTPILLSGGLLTGTGTIAADVTNGGTVQPGASPGLLTINGDYAQTSTGILNIELQGTAAGTQYDRLAITGDAMLDGTLNATLTGGFVPADGNTFDILTFASSTGVFATESLPTFPAGGVTTSSYLPTAVRLTATIIPDIADLKITKTGPATVDAGGTVTYSITVKNLGPGGASSVVVHDPTPNRMQFVGNAGDCATAFPCALGALALNQSKTILATYTVNPGTDGQAVTNQASVTSTTTDNYLVNNTAEAESRVSCPNPAPVAVSPASGATVSSRGTLSWTGSGTEYVVYLGPVGSGCTTAYAATTATSIPYDLAPGTTYEWRVESRFNACDDSFSSCRRFTTSQDCIAPSAPLASVVGQTTSAKSYDVTWNVVPGASRYEIEEATFEDFRDATTRTVLGTSATFAHTVPTGLPFYYRVRAFADCRVDGGPYSPTVRVVIVPLPPANRPNRNINVPFGNKDLIVQEVFVEGIPGVSAQYSATTDRPWLTVKPATGTLPPTGVTLQVIADPATLPNGTFTASVIVTITTPNASTVGAQGTVVIPSIPVSVSLVTPVTPVTSNDATSAHALIIPSVGHVSGINSQWQSDVRVTNTGFKPYRYRLTFTPAGGTIAGVKQTEITVDSGATTALDDVINNWYGFGALGDGTSGMLEIVPLDEPETASLVTVASSRTYNVTSNGTLGQFIPALRYASFVGRALEGAVPRVLSLQQIAQNEAYRTNVGVAEAAGQPVNLLLRIFDGAGARVLDVPVQLAAGEQRQLNSLLAQNSISLADGRIEVTVAEGDGKVTAYASVVDNRTLDPLAVTGTLLGDATASRFVLPGVANLRNPIANWRTDMRIFNYGSTTQTATLTFHPQNNGAAVTHVLPLLAGTMTALDNVVLTLFGKENSGGIVHLSTPQPASLVMTGRTYNDTGSGTFGQFIPAVTEQEATALGGRTLNILQVEDSVRYRTNLGLAEVTGKPVVVEVQVVLPDSKTTPTVQIPLAANEFRQFAVVRELGAGNVYNARITVRVIEGAGRVTAYGSVIDELTQDPTYVPAQ